MIFGGSPIRTPRRSLAKGVPNYRGTASANDGTAPDALDARLREVEAASPSVDFDAMSWFWMILLGALLPLGLIAYGWLTSGPTR